MPLLGRVDQWETQGQVGTRVSDQQQLVDIKKLWINLVWVQVKWARHPVTDEVV